MRCMLLFSVLLLMTRGALAADFEKLFPKDSLDGWKVSDWSDIAVPQKVDGQAWTIKDGVLTGEGKRTWLYSEKEYGDFTIRFEAKLGRGANGGFGMRFPSEGDPAYRGMEIQIVDGDVYYKGNGRAAQLTGSIYDEIAPDEPKAIKPQGEWNAFEIAAKGSHVSITINGKKQIDADLSKESTARQQTGKALAERPLKGRIGFQNLNSEFVVRKIEIKKE